MVGKKGQTSVVTGLMVLAMILAATGIAIILWTYISSNADNTYFWKNFYSKDVAFTADALLGVKGDVFFFYKMRNNNYNFQYDVKTSGVVEVYNPPDSKPTRFHFATNKEFGRQQPETASFFSSFSIQKKGKMLFFEEQKEPGCSFVTTTDAHFLDSYVFVGSVNKNTESMPYSFSELTKQYLASQHSFVLASSEQSSKMRIYFDQQEDDLITLKYITHKMEKNRQLQCIIHTKLLEINGLKLEKKEVLPGVLYSELAFEPSIVILIGKGIEQEKIIEIPEKLAIAIMQYYQ